MLVVTFLALVAFSGFEATFALFGSQHLGLGIASTAAVFTVVGAVIVAVQGGLVYRVVRVLGETTTLMAGLLANAGGLALLATARSWAVAVPALAALTVGQGLVQTTMVAIVAGPGRARLAGQRPRGPAVGRRARPG